MREELRLSGALAGEMIEHSKAARPYEACGILAKAGDEMVKVFRMTNASQSPVRYSLDPREQFAVYKKLDEENWDLGAVFHSHTHTEAYPSPTDVRLASEDVPYVIVSLVEDPPAVRAFRIVKSSWLDETGEIREMPVSIET
jgi:proteasome lid subunit RPN8/RPN11